VADNFTEDEQYLVQQADIADHPEKPISIATAIYTARMQREAADRLLTASKEIAVASEKQVRRLVWATWALFLATLGVVGATIALIFYGG